MLSVNYHSGMTEHEQRAPDQSEDNSRPVGRGMLIAGGLIGIGLLSLMFGNLLDLQRNPNQSIDSQLTVKGVREVVLERNRFGHYLATGSINDSEVEFLLDTGASDVSIPQAIAEELRLQPGRALTYSTANGNITAYMTHIPQLRLGNIVLHDIRASINPHMDGETILLGMSFLKHLEFTQRGDTLIIRQYPQQ